MGLLSDKTVIVTGAAQGIGAKIAEGVALEGAKVVIIDVLEGREVAERIKSKGGSALSFITDITSDEDLTKTIKETQEQFGEIDVLVNNAALFGALSPTPMQDLNIEEWDRVMRVNVRGVWQASTAVLKSMERQGGGAIINIATNRIFKGFPNLLHYDASKGAVLAMTKAMAAELGEKNIRVNVICPGLTMSENVKLKEGIEGRNEKVVSGRALSRSQQPEDLVGAVVFFASQQGSFISGQSLIVDGGGIMV